MRPYSYCLRANILCVTFFKSEFYKQCIRFGRFYELAWPAATVERLHQTDNKLLKEITDARR
jgi:hypothetical protein